MTIIRRNCRWSTTPIRSAFWQSFLPDAVKSVMPETGRVDKILEKRTAGSLQPLCEGVVVLGAVRKPDARAVPELLQTIADGDEDEIQPCKRRMECLLPERLPLSGTVLEPLPAGTPDGALVGACGGEPPRGGGTVK